MLLAAGISVLSCALLSDSSRVWTAAVATTSAVVLAVAVGSLARRVADHVEGQREQVQDLRELARIAATAPDLPAGISAAEPFVLRRTGGTSLHLRWDDETSEWTTFPDRAVLPLGHHGTGTVHLVVDGVTDHADMEAVGHVLSRLSERDELERHAHTDPITGVADRDHLDRLLRDRDASDGRTVAMLDLDDFARIDSDRGHDGSDALLHRFADVLTQQVRRVDDVARYGGARFCLLLATGPVESSRVVDRIRTAWAGIEPDAAFSAGVGSDIVAAERGLDQARRDGGNRTVVAVDPENPHATPTADR